MQNMPRIFQERLLRNVLMKYRARFAYNIRITSLETEASWSETE